MFLPWHFITSIQYSTKCSLFKNKNCMSQSLTGSLKTYENWNLISLQHCSLEWYSKETVALEGHGGNYNITLPCLTNQKNNNCTQL